MINSILVITNLLTSIVVCLNCFLLQRDEQQWYQYKPSLQVSTFKHTSSTPKKSVSHVEWWSGWGGGGEGGLEFSNQLKFSPLFSFFKIFAYSLKIIHYSLKCWLIFASFCMIQWRKSCLKPGFKADFAFHDRNAKANTSTQSEYIVKITCSRNNAIVQCIRT